jgi:hypothetical protein
MTDPRHERALVSVRAAVREKARVNVFARSHRMVAGESLSFDREDAVPSGLEHLLTAVASDLVAGFARLARKRRILIDGLEASLQAEVDGALVWLGVVGESGEPRLTAVSGTLYVSSPAGEAVLGELWRDVQAQAPLCAALAGNVRMDVRLAITS